MSGPVDSRSAETHLSAIPLFSRLSKKHLHTLADTASDRFYSAGDIIMRQGEKANGLYLVVEGQVEIVKSGKAVATLGPGQIFGEMVLLDEQPAPRAFVRTPAPGASSSSPGSSGPPSDRTPQRCGR